MRPRPTWRFDGRRLGPGGQIKGGRYGGIRVRRNVKTKNAVFGWKPGRSDIDANYTFLSTDEVVELHQRYSPLDHFQ